MKFIADLHIHSHFSRATSKTLTPEYLDYYAGLKGIKIVGTGDFTHPGWLAELKEKTEPDGNGLFKLKKEYRLESPFDDNETRFLLTSEISNIYKRGEKVRKVHNVLLVPGFEEAEKINEKLVNMGGNLATDGRPILGLDSRNLLEIVLECSEKNHFIPGCEEGLLPYSLYKNEVDRDEEKRLLYVGMTRAKKLLYLTRANSRMIRGRKFRLEKSPFLESIQQELIQLVKNKPPKKPEEKDNQLSLF